MSVVSNILEFIIDSYSKIRSFVSYIAESYSVELSADERMWLTFVYVASVVFVFILAYRAIRWFFRI